MGGRSGGGGGGDSGRQLPRPSSAPAESVIEILKSGVQAEGGAELTFVIGGVEYRTRVDTTNDALLRALIMLTPGAGGGADSAGSAGADGGGGRRQSRSPRTPS